MTSPGSVREETVSLKHLHQQESWSQGTDKAEGNSDSKPVGAAEMIAGHGGRDKKTRTKNWYVDGEAD